MKERHSNTRIYFSSIVCNYSLQSLTCNADEHSVSNASKTKNYCICSWWDGMRWRHVKCSTQMSPTLASKLVCSLVWHHYPLGLHHSGFHETGFTPASFSSSVLQRPSSPQLTIMRDSLKRACFFMEVSSSRSTISQHDFKCYQGTRVFCQEGFLV